MGSGLGLVGVGVGEAVSRLNPRAPDFAARAPLMHHAHAPLPPNINMHHNKHNAQVCPRYDFEPIW